MLKKEMVINCKLINLSSLQNFYEKARDKVIKSGKIRN